ncbi:hypothetical protein [Rhizobium terrae]|uniref:hypothetical protein n=1 Tax=Rhizobium terrae TaxID=2171756 RepID=UPI000E3EA9CC|nr:hypothetical protein [Rhizobium terrae]
MFMRFAVFSLITLAFTGAVSAQTSEGDPATLPGAAPTAPGAGPTRSNAPLPPGVTDPMATNSTTGTVDQEDHCQPPGTAANSNPSAEAPTLPRPEPACN